MPRSKIEPYVPVAQAYNDDPETWELTDEFGDRSVRTHIEILTIMERTNNHWRLVEGWQSAIGRKCRQSPKTIQGIVEWMIARGWLTISQWLASYPPAIGQLLASGPPMVGQLLASGWPVILRVGNYPKFHKVDVPSRLEAGFEYVFPLPLLTLHPKKEEEYIGLLDTVADTSDQTGDVRGQFNGSQSMHKKEAEDQEAERKRLMRESGLIEPDEEGG